jgi:hypothetical protein
VSSWRRRQSGKALQRRTREGRRARFSCPEEREHLEENSVPESVRDRKAIECVWLLIPYQSSRPDGIPPSLRTPTGSPFSQRLGIYPYRCVLQAVGAATSWPTSMGETKRMGNFERLALPQRSSPTRRAVPVGKTDRVLVGRAREVGWRQLCHNAAVRGRRPDQRQGRPWSFSA